MKSLYYCLCFLLVTGVYAQENGALISGKITDENGEPLPGVNIVIKGSTKGVVTDLEGRYSLSAGSEDVLVISFIGMRTQEETVGSRSVIDIQMALDSETLSEIVVVAYGEESKRNLMGSVAAIDASTIENQQVTSITRSLSGTVPGVSVISSSGQPGSAPTIRIRGVGSIDSGNDPLIVLDGSVYSGNINSIPQGDIASISVLKDASASALYGSRAANGVLLITTKKGKFTGGKWSKPNIDFIMSMGVSERAVKEYPYVNAKTAMRMEWEALKNDAVDNKKDDNPGQTASEGLLGRVGYNPFGGSGSPIDAEGNFLSDKLLWDTDWLGSLMSNSAMRRRYSLNISGGSDKISYFFGGNILDQDGQVFNSGFKRYAGRMNVEVRATKWLTVGFRQAVSSSQQNFPTQDGNSYSNTIQWARTVSNIYPIYRRDENGELVRDNSGNLIYDDGDGKGKLNSQRPVLSPGNTVGVLKLSKYDYKRFTAITNASIEARFLKDFTVKTNYQLSKYFLNKLDYGNQTIGSAKSVGGRIARQRQTTTEWTWTNYLTWKKSYNQHNIEALLLQELYSYTRDRIDADGTGIPFGGLYELASTATPETTFGYTRLERIASFMGRVKYNYRNKYYVEGSYRFDQSSRFSPAARNGNFYSAAASWILSEEPFLKRAVPVVSFMKMRISYGEIGNNQIQENINGTITSLYFPYMNTYETGFDQLSRPGVYPNGLANGNITWETVATLNLGFDFGFFKDRLTGSVDLYNAVTRGLVTGLSTTPSRGVRNNKITKNIGDVTNRGVEVILTGDVIKTNRFTWTLSANIAFEKNIITKFPEKERVNGSKKLVEGRSIYDFWIREYAGVDPEDGRPMWWVDSLAEDGETVLLTRAKTTKNYDDASRNFVGTALPWARGGFSSRMYFRGFDFSVLINFALGGKILDYDYAGLMHGGRRSGQQYTTDILRRWQAPGDITDVPRLSSNDRGNSRSTRFLFDATYARVRNITLGYSMPSSVLDKLGGFVKSFRIFFSGDNLFTLFGRKGLDPEQGFAGITDNQSSVLRTYSGGLELKF